MSVKCDMCKVIEQIKNNENPYFVKELETGYVILGWNQHFYGYTLFICKQHKVELFELDIIKSKLLNAINQLIEK